MIAARWCECGGRTDAEAKSVQDLMAGKRLVIGTISPANSTHDVPSILNATLDTNMQLVPGYAGFQRIKLAIQAREVEGICGGWDGFPLVFEEMLQGEKPEMRILVSVGNLSPQAQALPYFQGVPVAESLAKTEEARQLLRIMSIPAQISKPFAVGPDVPLERLAALRRAFVQTYADQQFLAKPAKPSCSWGSAPARKCSGPYRSWPVCLHP